MQDKPEDGTKIVSWGAWVEVYRRGVGWTVLHSAPTIGINTAAQEYWLKRNDIGRSNNEGEPQ